ncbi:MAG: aldose 1-epimerase [Pyrinomonadaceae bacterium]
MKYSVVSETRHGVEIFMLREADEARAEIAPALGNNCFALDMPDAVLEDVPFDQFLARPTSYGIPILFPYPNRIRDSRFAFRGETYTVDQPQHGFVRGKAWKVLDTGASENEGAWIRSGLDANDYAEQILQQFPFPFNLQVTYRLKNERLEMETVAQNTGDRVMPLGFGIHPYFQLPAQSRIQVPAQKRWELVDNFPTGNLLDVEGHYDLRRPQSTDGLSLDDIYTDATAEPDNLTRCFLFDDANNKRTVVEFDAQQFPHIVVYTTPAPRRAICIEPNTCPTDAFNLQQRGIESNVIALDAGASVNFKISVYRQSAPTES